MGPEVIIATFVPLAFFALIFGIFYVRNRENIALIERGINPRNGTSRPRPFVNLKYGLLLIGSGLGLLSAYIIDVTILSHNRSGGTAQVSHHEGGHSGAKHTVVVSASGVNVSNSSPEKAADTGKDIAAKATSAGQHVAVSGDSAKVKDSDEDDDDNDVEVYYDGRNTNDNPSIYFALIAIGGGLGLFFSYRIEKKEWIDKKGNDLQG